MTVPSPLRMLASPSTSEGSQNPYIDLLYENMADQADVELAYFSKRLAVTSRWDVVHFHWPEWSCRFETERVAALDTVQLVGVLRLARLRGAKVVWTAHDTRPHGTEGRGRVERFMRAFVRQVDLVIALSADSVDELGRTYPHLRRVRTAVIPHGHYRGVYPDTVPRPEARQRLGLPATARVALVFGQLKEYKNIPALISSFRRVAGPDDRLVVAGRPDTAATEALIRAEAAGDPRVTVAARHVADDEVQVLFRACDVVVLPYTAILNSGAAILGLSFDRPVVVPALGSLRELARDVPGGWVRTFTGLFDDDDMRAALDAVTPPGAPDLAALDWKPIATRTLAAYAEARHRPSRSATPGGRSASQSDA